MKVDDIAMVCYAVNNAYRVSLGEMARVSWDKLPEENKQNLIKAVENPKAPEQQHNEWLENKMIEGWVYDKVENLEEKKSPQLVPYQALSEEQKTKDVLFTTIIESMKGIVADPDTQVIIAEPVVGKIPVKYIGKRPEYTDGAYGTDIHWNKGETKMVEETVANKLLRHIDQYVRGDVMPDEPETVMPNDGEPEEDEDAVQDAKDAVNAMNRKQALIDFAEVNFQGVKLSNTDNIATLKQKVTGFIDQYGLI